MSSIEGINLNPIGLETLPNTASTAKPDGTFKNMLLESIQKVNSMQQDADRAVEGLITGEDVNAAEVLTAVQKADLTFRMMMQVRNKTLQAFEEIRNIRI
ncbi:MAG: flagellar hook-basal body complex protein FliE [Pirellulales bacterium]